MTQLSGYNPALVRYAAALPAKLAHEEFNAQPITDRWPTFLGLVAAFYLLSVATLSSASEYTAWIPQVVGAIFGVCWVVVGVFLKGQPIAWSKPITYFVLFTLWAGTGVVVTTSQEYFYTLYNTSLKVTIVTWIALQCVRSRQDFLICCLLMGAGSLILLFHGMDAIMRSIQFTGKTVVRGARVEGTLIFNQNELGQFGVTVAAAAIACLLGYRSKFLKVLALAPIVAGLYIVAASGSRLAMVGFIVLSIGVYWFHFRKAGAGSVGRKLMIAILSLGLLGGSLYYVKNLPFFFRLVQVFSSGDEARKEPRFQFFLSAMKATIEHPILGMGMGGFSLAGYGRGPGGLALYSHSTVSEVMCCQGIPGFLLYFGGRLALFLLLLRTRKLGLSPQDFAVVNILTAFFGAIVVFDIVTVDFQDRLLWPFLGAACGYLMNLNRQYAVDPAYAAY